MAQRKVKRKSTPKIDPVEWQLRCELAATFRLCARNKWNEGIGNHNSAMIPGTELPSGFCRLRQRSATSGSASRFGTKFCS